VNVAKCFRLDIDQAQAVPYVTAIRSKKDIIVVWMQTIKNYLVGHPATGANIHANLSIQVTKMTRLFCTSGQGIKIFSIAFPFSVECNDGQYQFKSKQGVVIDSAISSDVLALVQFHDILSSTNIEQFMDPLLDIAERNSDFWCLIRELMTSEDGYIRYDHDLARQAGHLHPLHHMDIFYSSASTFKVGLQNLTSEAALASIVDPTTDCHYLVPPNR
jgi:hypothetical protein